MEFNSENIMKASNVTVAVLTLAVFSSISVTTYAQIIEIPELSSNASIEDVTMNIVENAREHSDIIQGDKRHTIYDYMLANGDLTQEQINTLVAERESIKTELNALRDSGNNEALAARITELREERKNNQTKLRIYVDTHEDLAATISNYREEITEQHNKRDRHSRNDRDTRR